MHNISGWHIFGYLECIQLSFAGVVFKESENILPLSDPGNAGEEKERETKGFWLTPKPFFILSPTPHFLHTRIILGHILHFVIRSHLNY